MPLGRGVDPTDPRHAEVTSQWRKAREIIENWNECSALDIASLKQYLIIMEDELADYYWQSSSAECPEDNAWRGYETVSKNT